MANKQRWAMIAALLSGAFAYPASASVVTYTYDGPEMTCYDGDDCGNLTTFTGASFSVDDADPGFGGGNLLFNLSLGGGGNGIVRVRESIYQKDSGITSLRDEFCIEDCPITYSKPSFFVGDGSWDAALPHNGGGFLASNDVVMEDDYKAVMLDFAGGLLINWKLEAGYSGYHTFLISSAPDQCNRGGPAGHYDCTADDFVSVSSEPGTWTRTPPVAPVPLPTGGLLLLAAAASIFAVRRVVA